MVGIPPVSSPQCILFDRKGSLEWVCIQLRPHDNLRSRNSFYNDDGSGLLLQGSEGGSFLAASIESLGNLCCFRGHVLLVYQTLPVGELLRVGL